MRKIVVESTRLTLLVAILLGIYLPWLWFNATINLLERLFFVTLLNSMFFASFRYTKSEDHGKL